MTELASVETLRRFLHPTSAALIGRLERHLPPEQIIANHRSRWGDDFYFVNPSGGTFGGREVYERVVDIPTAVDLAVVSVGRERVPDVMKECAAGGVGNVVIFTGGFGELGSEGVRLEGEIAALARELGVRVLGPNTNTNAFEPMPDIGARRGGAVGVITQSGNQGRPFAQAGRLGVQVSRWIATGNEADLDVCDFIRYFAYDDATSVIACYVEGFRNADKLRAALTDAREAGKPVICLKMGRTAAGSQMAASHTGHLTGSDRVIDGLFQQFGVTRVDDLDELIETSSYFAKTPPLPGGRVAIYGASGGVSTLLAENAERSGLLLPELSQETQRTLHEYLPGYLTVRNPVDNGMQFMGQPLERRVAVLQALADDPSVDVIVTGNNMGGGPMAAKYVEDLVRFRESADTPIVCVWGSPVEPPELFAELAAAGVPIFRSSRNCTRAIAAHRHWSASRDRERTRTPSAAPSAAPLGATVRGPLANATAIRLLDDAGIPRVHEWLTTSPGEAGRIVTELGGPAVLKIASPDFPHRSDVGLVRLDVGPSDAESVYTELVERARSVKPDATIEGIVVQRQLASGLEMIVGLTRDPVIGPAVLVGLGGVFAEVFDDVAVRPVPLDRFDIDEMLRSLKIWPLLDGARGTAVDIGSLVHIVSAVADLALAHPDLQELDLNPVLVGPDGAVAVDVLAVAGPVAEDH